MKFLNRLIPWATFLAVLLLIEQIFKNPLQVYWQGLIILVIVAVGVFLLVGRKLTDRKLRFLILTPVLFISSGILFSSFLQGNFVKHLFALILSAATSIFLEMIYSKFNNRVKYQPHSLENISFNLNFITVFLAASGFFSLIIFIGLPFGLFWALFTIVIFLLNYQLVWLSNNKIKDGLPYIVVITLVMAEIFWAVNYLPTSVYVNGLLVAISYYLMAGLAHNWLLEIKEFKVVRRYLFTSLIILVIILITAKWF